MQNSPFLPHREIPVFDGDPLQFNSFIKAFEHCVEAKTNDKGACLYYFEQFTKGQPRNLVRSCLHMAPERHYIVTKNLLEEHFGNGLMVTAAYMEEINGWPSVKSEDTKGLQAYALYLRECSNAMEELQYLEELNMPANMKKTQFKRNSFATRVSITDECNADARKSDRVQRELTPSPKTNPISCQYCKRGHTLDQCLQLGRKAHREKLNFLKEKCLCFACLCTGHLSKNYDRHIICRQCNQTHPSLLHIEKREKSTHGDTELTRKASESCTTTSACGHTGAGHSNGILPILPVQ